MKQLLFNEGNGSGGGAEFPDEMRWLGCTDPTGVLFVPVAVLKAFSGYAIKVEANATGHYTDSAKYGSTRTGQTLALVANREYPIDDIEFPDGALGIDIRSTNRYVFLNFIKQ